MRVCQWNVDALQPDRMIQLPPIRRDHVGRGRNSCRPTEFSEDLAPGITVFGAARILRVSQYTARTAAKLDRLLERPRPIRINRDTRLWIPFGQSGDRIDFGHRIHDAAFELEICKSIFRVCRLGESNYGLGIQCRFIAQSPPLIALVAFVAVGEWSSRTVADEKQISQHRHGGTLLSVAQQGAHRYVKQL